MNWRGLDYVDVTGIQGGMWPSWDVIVCGRDELTMYHSSSPFLTPLKRTSRNEGYRSPPTAGGQTPEDTTNNTYYPTKALLLPSPRRIGSHNSEVVGGSSDWAPTAIGTENICSPSLGCHIAVKIAPKSVYLTRFTPFGSSRVGEE